MTEAPRIEIRPAASPQIGASISKQIQRRILPVMPGQQIVGTGQAKKPCFEPLYEIPHAIGIPGRLPRQATVQWQACS